MVLAERTKTTTFRVLESALSRRVVSSPSKIGIIMSMTTASGAKLSNSSSDFLAVGGDSTVKPELGQQYVEGAATVRVVLNDQEFASRFEPVKAAVRRLGHFHRLSHSREANAFLHFSSGESPNSSHSF